MHVSVRGTITVCSKCTEKEYVWIYVCIHAWSASQIGKSSSFWMVHFAVHPSFIFLVCITLNSVFNGNLYLNQ